ncbi:hypothetical protein KP509_04G092300 [Ceratopteris richardii]|nr:hypothetical protein KP509_04G092300 [Ceratopteris richardii]
MSNMPSGKTPWLLFWGINELIHTRSAAFAYDPLAGRWFQLAMVRPPIFNRASLGGANGAFFAFSGSKVCFTQVPTKLRWKETPPAMYSRCFSLLNIIGSPNSHSFKFVVFGGIIDEGQRFLEIYDSSSDTWECHDDSLPEDLFLDGISSHCMSSAILGHNFYVANYDGSIAVFSLSTKLWSRLQRLQITGLVNLSIVAGDSELFALCICRGKKGECLRLYEVNDISMDCTFVNEMPREFFSLFQDTDDQKEASLRCLGAGGIVYVYSEQYYKGYPVCACDLRGGKYVWRQLPPLPSPPRFDRVVCCSTAIVPGDCFEISCSG